MTFGHFISRRAEDLDPIGERDLLAYADGHLCRDPARRAAVHRLLEQDAEAAERVASYQAQNEALRAAGTPWLDRPPEHLVATVFAEKRPNRLRRMAPAAGIALLIMTAATVGLLVGLRWQEAAPGGLRFTEAGVIDAGVIDARERWEGGGQLMLPASNGGWASRPSTAIDPLDLTALGLSLQATRSKDFIDGPATRLTYVTADGREANLYLRLRPLEGPGEQQWLHSSNLKALQWTDGPFSIALTAHDLSDAEIEAVAQAVRHSISQASLATGHAGADGHRPVDMAVPRRPSIEDLSIPALQPTVQSN